MVKEFKFKEGVSKELYEHIISLLKENKISYKAEEQICAIAIGLKGRSYQFNSYLICGNYYLTLSVRLPVTLDESNYIDALKIARKYTIENPIGGVEVLREIGPVAVKIGLPIGEDYPSSDLVMNMLAHGLRLAENCAADFFDLVKVNEDESNEKSNNNKE